MQKNFKRFVVTLLIACFAVSSTGGVALAYHGNRHDNGHRNHGNRYSNYGHRYDRDRSERFALRHLNVSRSAWDYARRNDMTMRDVMISKRIADRNRYLSVEEVLRMRNRGHSYRWIADRHHVRWDRIDHEVNDSHRGLARDAIKIGLVIWALDELID